MDIESIIRERQQLQQQQQQQQQHNNFHHDSSHSPSPLTTKPIENKQGGNSSATAKQLASAPSISEDFKRWHLQTSMSMDDGHHRAYAANEPNDTERRRNSTPPLSTPAGFLLQETQSPKVTTATKTGAPVVQQTSVITSVRQSSTEKPPRLSSKNLQRQKSITEDDDIMEYSAAHRKHSGDNNNNNNNNNSNSNSTTGSSNKHGASSNERKTLPHSIAFFLDDSSSYNSNHHRHQTTPPKPQSFERTAYPSSHQSGHKLKSKSLDLMDNEVASAAAASAVTIDYGNKSGSRGSAYMPIHYHHHRHSPAKHSSFESDDQGARYINALHITPPAPLLYGGATSSGSYPNSPGGASGESPKEALLFGVNRHSPAANSISPIAKRVLLNDIVTGSPSMIGTRGRRSPRGPTSEHFTSEQQFTLRGSREHIDQHAPFTKSRSQDLQMQRHQKYVTQKKAHTLGTAPYDVHGNLRRILSEENVPENLRVNKSLKNFYTSGMRRAASYDLISRLSNSPTNNSSNFRQSSEPTNYMRHQLTTPATNQTNGNTTTASGKSTKIIFPEHDNVSDCDSIFTQPIVDERAHAQRINQIMSDFPTTTSTHSPNTNAVNNSISPNLPHHYQQQQHHHGNNHKMVVHPLQQSLLSSYDDVMGKVTSPSSSNNNNKNRNSGGDVTSSKQGGIPGGGCGTTKSLTNQNSMDKNYTIGPYQYDADIDDDVAVNVSGLLTLPGSNEKK